MGRSAGLVPDSESGAWILRVDLPDERIPKPRTGHSHIDVESPEAAAIYLRHLNELVGPVKSNLEHYSGRWYCSECKAWRLAP
jgi:hypothetical protein